MPTQGPSFDLSGQVACITGGNRGIGRAIALGFAHAGASVAILARDGERSAHVKREIEAIGVASHACALDVTDRAALAPALAQVEEALGPLDILVNNAGNTDISGGVLHQSQNGWDNAIATHLTATMLLSKLAATSMSERGSGKIINLASMYSIFGAAALPSYGAAKGGIVQLTKAMAVELAPHGVQVNAIAPGHIVTERGESMWDEVGNDAGFRLFELHYPVRRTGIPEDIANAVAFLCSNEASFITGQVLAVDGGMTIQLQENIVMDTKNYIAANPDLRTHFDNTEGDTSRW